MSILQGSILMLEMSDIEVMYDECSSFNIGDSARVMAQEEMNDNEFGKAGDDEAPFMAGIADMLSSVASVLSNATFS